MRHVGAGGLTPILAALFVIALCGVVIVARVLQ